MKIICKAHHHGESALEHQCLDGCVACLCTSCRVTSVDSTGPWTEAGVHLRVVQMVQDHHAAVLRSPDGVELVVVPLMHSDTSQI